MISCRSGFTPRLPRDANWKMNMDKQDGRDEKLTLAKLAETAKGGGKGASSFARWDYGVTGRAPIRNFVFLCFFVAVPSALGRFPLRVPSRSLRESFLILLFSITIIRGSSFSQFLILHS